MRPASSVKPKILVLAGLLAVAALLGCHPAGAAADFGVKLYSGEDFRLSQQPGGTSLVLNFWYPSCPPCREELPHLEAAWGEYGSQGVRFLGLFVPRGFDTEGDARHFIQELGLTFDFGTDRRAEIAASYGVEVFPTTYFIDQEGMVFRKAVGRLDQARLDEIVGELVRN